MATKATKPAAKPAAPGKEVALKKSASIVSIKEALALQVAGLAGRTAPPGGDAIQITQDKFFKLPDGTKAQELQLVIVDFLAVNRFYEGAFDKDNISPPACFAFGESPTELVPSAKSPVKQSNACASCPMNQWGSDGKGKACKNGRILAVLPPDADDDTPIMVLNVSPTALKGFDGFVNSIARQFQLPPVGVVCTVTFDANETYAKLVFSDPQPNTMLAEHFARQGEARKRLLVEPDVSAYEAPKPATKQTARRK